MNQYWILHLPVIFPAGVATGGQRGFNHLKIARDGLGHPILRGSSIAGVIRHALKRERGFDMEQLENLFGRAADNEGPDLPSRIVVADARLNPGSAPAANVRTHHQRDRHTKAVLPHGLFSLEATPPGTTADLLISLGSAATGQQNGDQIMSAITALFDQGIGMGGNQARGVGRAELRGQPQVCHFDLSDLNQHAEYLNLQYQLSTTDFSFEQLKPLWQPCQPLGPSDNVLEIKLQLRIPRGQDLLVAGSQEIPRPQTIISADGQVNYLIPGSTFRGLFRSYMTKLAAKQGHVVADSHQRRLDFEQTHHECDQPTGENHGRAFLNADQREHLKNRPQDHADVIACPIARLFGSLYQASRIRFSDAIVAQSSPGLEEQNRKHVAIDRFTGGAAESLLFENDVLVPTSKEPTIWNLAIRIQQPKTIEVNWLLQSIIALDIGLLRVGSSKSAGRLELAQSPQATGPHADSLTGLQLQSNPITRN